MTKLEFWYQCVFGRRRRTRPTTKNCLVQPATTLKGTPVLSVKWDTGKEETYPAVWLRDNCQCPDCYVESAMSRKLQMKNLDVNIKMLELTLDQSSDQVDFSLHYKKTLIILFTTETTIIIESIWTFIFPDNYKMVGWSRIQIQCQVPDQIWTKWDFRGSPWIFRKTSSKIMGVWSQSAGTSVPRHHGVRQSTLQLAAWYVPLRSRTYSNVDFGHLSCRSDLLWTDFAQRSASKPRGFAKCDKENRLPWNDPLWTVLHSREQTANQQPCLYRCPLRTSLGPAILRENSQCEALSTTTTFTDESSKQFLILDSIFALRGSNQKWRRWKFVFRRVQCRWKNQKRSSKRVGDFD